MTDFLDLFEPLFLRGTPFFLGGAVLLLIGGAIIKFDRPTRGGKRNE